MKLEPSMKKNEQLFGPKAKLRSRVIWNPSDFLKVFGGTLNFNLIKIIK